MKKEIIWSTLVVILALIAGYFFSEYGRYGQGKLINGKEIAIESFSVTPAVLTPDVANIVTVKLKAACDGANCALAKFMLYGEEYAFPSEITLNAWDNFATQVKAAYSLPALPRCGSSSFLPCREQTEAVGANGEFSMTFKIRPSTTGTKSFMFLVGNGTGGTASALGVTGTFQVGSSTSTGEQENTEDDENIPPPAETPYNPTANEQDDENNNTQDSSDTNEDLPEDESDSGAVSCDSCASCRELLQNATTATEVQLTQDIIYVAADLQDGACIYLTQSDSNSVFDCNHKEIKPSSASDKGDGIKLGLVNNLTVRDCKLSDNKVAIKVGDPIIRKRQPSIPQECNDNTFESIDVTNNAVGITIRGEGNMISDYGSAGETTGITLFGNGNTVNNASSSNLLWGIQVYGDENIVSDSQFQASRSGVYLGVSASDNTIENVTASTNGLGEAFTLGGGPNAVKNCAASNSPRGFALYGHDYLLEENTSTASSGFYLTADARNNVFRNNQACNNSYGFFVRYQQRDNSGTGNTCQYTYGWNDTGVTGCSNSCS